ncbi:MAG: [citrate (pro-3S)-lyase] ligase, partial [Candidatus Heimdallarchaeota archaeon]|nr:[citrate (pro-3S)-lyase] ligase [Candidatus Heimdallarchaeota archaeon]
YQTYSVEYYHNPNEKEKVVFREFLNKQGLTYEEDVELTIKIIDPLGEMVATGSIAGKVLKCIAVDPKKRGEGLSAKVLSELVKEQFKRGRNHLFVFTSPQNLEETSGNVFAGFQVVAKTDEIVLLEMGSKSIDDYLKQLKSQTLEIRKKYPPPIGSIVVNCNPFTLGHQYLIETAAKECNFIYVFVVMEDRSLFPTKVREKLVKAGTQHLENVLVLPGEDYIISPATFPRYFMKDFNDIVLAQARLDITIFAEYIAPALGITRRYVGEEPYCDVTSAYNQAMREILQPKGVDLEIVERKELKGRAISASTVRSLIKKGKMEEVKKLVPETTYQFLRSKEAQPIIEEIKHSNSRH